MSLLCRECDDILEGPYQILCLLGHTRTGLVQPQESAVREVICDKHKLGARSTIPPSHLFPVEPGTNALVFAVVPGIPFKGKNFNGAYSLSQDGQLRKSGYFPNTVYLASDDVGQMLPTLFRTVMDESSHWSEKLAFYKAALEHYRVNITKINLPMPSVTQGESW